jgi:Protein of unknown function (DUF2937)
MIIRRLALFFAVLSGLLTTQMPEYWQQYRQRLEGAIDELSSIVARFDADNAAHNLSQSQGIAHLESSSDPLVVDRGVQMEKMVLRLQRLKQADFAFDEHNLPRKWWTLATNFDPTVAVRAYETYQPAVPTTSEGFIAGMIGFFVGGALVHLIGLPIRFRHKLFRRRDRTDGVPRPV